MPELSVDKNELIEQMHEFNDACALLAPFAMPSERGYKTARKEFDKAARKLCDLVTGQKLTNDELQYIWNGWKKKEEQ